MPGTIASLEKVTLGGWPQAVLLRGVDETRPVLLYLHGGPGDAEIWTARRRQAELERAFLVANWDQRGAGLSYDSKIPRDSMTIEQLVSDTVELSRWLAQRFHRERIVLMGHSWGTILGLLAARRAPDLYQAYIGIGQVVEPAESELRMYRWAVKEAQRLGKQHALRELEESGPPPYAGYREFRRARKWVARFGGRVHERHETSMALDALVHLREYTLRDLFRWEKGSRFSVSTLIEEAAAIDLPSRVSSLRIPTYFVSGRYDRICDPDLAREYLRALDAPRKGWAWIEDAAHMAPWEQPDAVAAAAAHFAEEAERAPPPTWSLAG